MRSLLQIIGKQETSNDRVFYLNLNKCNMRYTIEIKQHQVQKENLIIPFIYEKLLETEIEEIQIDESLVSKLHKVANKIAYETRRGAGNTIIAPKSLIEILNQYVSGFEFIESDLPDQSLVIIAYKGKMTDTLEQVDTGIIAASSDSIHYDGIFIRSNYNEFYKVLKIIWYYC